MAEQFDMLLEVKNALGVTGNYQDATLATYINSVNEYMLDAGVDASLIGTQKTAGAVARGVADLWQYGSGDGKLSTYFYERVIQLSKNRVVQDGEL